MPSPATVLATALLARMTCFGVDEIACPEPVAPQAVLPPAALYTAAPPERSPTTELTTWSEAERRAILKHAWRCSHQGTPRKERYGVMIGGRLDPRCDFRRILCREIAGGAQATGEERALCATFAAHEREQETGDRGQGSGSGWGSR